MRLLLVEDDRSWYEDLTLLLPEDVELVWAADSRQALSRIATDAPFGAIILDLVLPHHLANTNEEEGLALLAHIRRTVTAKPAVIVCTSQDPEDYELQCRRLGIRAFLRKSSGIDALIRVIGTVPHQGVQ